MKNRLLILGIFNVLLCLSAGSDVFAQKLFMTLERVDVPGIGTFADSLEGVGPDKELYLSVYGNNMTGLISYSLQIEFDKSKFKDNVEFIFTRTGDVNPLASADIMVNKLETLGVGTTYYSVAVSLGSGASGVNLTDWEFFGRLKLETSSTFSGDAVFNFRLVEDKSPVILTNPGFVGTSVTNVNTAYINLITDIDDDNDGGAIPESYSLGQNYPNPFNPSTTIPFEMNITGNTKITIYNILGQEVAIALNSFLPAGKHTIQFDANSMSSGIYFYKLEVNDFTEMKRFVLIR